MFSIQVCREYESYERAIVIDMALISDKDSQILLIHRK